MTDREKLYIPSERPNSPRPPVQPDLVHLEGSVKQALDVGRTRLLVAGTVFALAFAVVAVRLVDLSLTTSGNEPGLARESTGSSFQTGRADILDRRGAVLATTLPTASLYANPRQVRRPAQVAAQLVEILPALSEAKLKAQLSTDRAFNWVKRNLTPAQHYAINRLGIPGLYFQREQRRFYPHGALLPHSVGFTGLDNVGLAGIEQSLDGTLRSAAQPLALSVDLRIQHILTEELAANMQEFRAIGAAGMVMDARSGEIVAMVSLPSFDPSQPGGASDEARFNRATLGIYEMGSVFKIFTTALALDRQVVTLDDGYDVSQPIKVSRFTIRDFKPKGPWLTVPEIFIYSSNIGTVHMAMETGTKAQQDFLQALGFLSTPALELSEVGQPMLPAPWREINTMTISYGHGLAVSPLQLMSAVAAIVNGGVLRPATLLKRSAGDPDRGKRVIRAETSQVMRELMRLVVTDGTGRKANAEGYLVGGKTGTADKLSGRRYSNNARIASFVGAFPMNDPRYVVFAMIDEPKGNKSTHGYATGGWVAAPVVRRLVERMGPLVGIQPADSEAADERSNQILVRAKAQAKDRKIASN